MAKMIKRNGVYYTDYTAGGKRIRRALGSYKEQAEQLFKDLLSIRASERHGTQPKDVSWFYFTERYLKYCLEEKKANSHYSDKHAIEMVERYGRPLTMVSQMTPEYLMDFKSKCKAVTLPGTRKRKKFEDKTIISYMARIKTAMKWGTKMDLCPMQNWDAVPTPPPESRKEFMDLEGFYKTLAVCKGKWRTAAMLMGFGGLRSGEVRYLRWEDVDFKNRLIRIQAKDIVHPDGTTERWTPKSKMGKYTEGMVPMIDELQVYLESLPIRRDHTRSGFVLGGELTKDWTYRQYFRRLSKRVGFKVFAHKFRHSHASFLLDSGSSLPQVGAVLRHKDSRSTEIYKHLSTKVNREAMDRLQASLPKTGTLEVIRANAGH